MKNANGTDRQLLKKDILQEKRHLDETLRLFLEIRNKDKPTQHEIVAVSFYIHNLYMGMENIFRRILEFNKIKVVKSETYHKDMLKKAVEQSIIPAGMYDTLYEFANFRHRVVHGYGFMLEKHKMQFLVDNAQDVIEKFFGELTENKYI